MSLTYKFDEKDKNSSQRAEDKTNEKNEKDIQLYDTPGNSRNVCFIEANGKQTFLNYAYLISGEYLPEKNSIELNFASHSIKLKGHNLEWLFIDIHNQQAKKIYCIDKRYENTIDQSQIFVTELDIKKHD